MNQIPLTIAKLQCRLIGRFPTSTDLRETFRSANIDNAAERIGVQSVLIYADLAGYELTGTHEIARIARRLAKTFANRISEPHDDDPRYRIQSASRSSR